eukprot:CAMPEP_0203872120 /NCGR_PEP_ID=MMETSP0359-20131031/19084_1 /ASSEMBLY_ACC=CAM_ASM_000338 /TAXON_ID=268821 /ORGANISM="Scrippsiella Hangoei, Strain SHTV-5" /LENGTH=814 /DNA_ID=CAMNT_0050790805 /DNA_START=54 /DNA_END=2499 /DNA_ORIENTATION=+
MAPAVSTMAAGATVGAAALYTSQAFLTLAVAPQAPAASAQFLGQTFSSTTGSTSASGAAALVATALGASALAASSARGSRRALTTVVRAVSDATAVGQKYGKAAPQPIEDPWEASKSKPFAAGLIGKALLPGGEYPFDPLGLSVRSEKYLPWLRESELKHGRVAMLAFVGFVVPEFVRIPGPDACYTAPVMKALQACGPSNGIADVQNGVFNTGPLYQVFLFCGIIEMCTTYPKFMQDANGPNMGFTVENAGDYRLGVKFMPKEPEKAKELKLKELNNGRLAMIAFAGISLQMAVTGNQSFPWTAHRQDKPSQSLASGIAPASKGLASRSSATTLRAYKMSKAVPFLPLSPAMEGVVGGEDEGFDPMGFSYAFDIRWLREAELKHGRICMLATVGWIATDLGMRVSDNAAFQVNSIDAHLSMVKFGSMAQMLVWLGFAELFGFMAMIRMYQGKTDRAAGDFGFRALYPKDEAGQDQMQLKELRNGRLAMLAYGGIVTAAVLTGKPWPFFAVAEQRVGASSSRSAFCGSLKTQAVRGSAMAAKAEMERSASLPFLPKPAGLKGLVGEEVGFDPLAFAETFDPRWLREAELKHGRVSMVATLGFAAQQFITFPGITPTPNANEAIYTANPAGWAALLFLAGFIESTSYGGKITMLDMFEGKRDPGNFEFGSGFLKGKNDKQVNDMKLKELSNGRLAMMAIGGMIHHNFVVQGPLFPLIPEGWTTPAAWVTPDGEPIQSFMSGFVNGTSGLISNNTSAPHRPSVAVCWLAKIHHNFGVKGPIFPLIPDGWTQPADWTLPDGTPIDSVWAASSKASPA